MLGLLLTVMKFAIRKPELYAELKAKAAPPCVRGLLMFASAGVSFVYPDSIKSREKTVAFSGWADSGDGMIHGGFLSKEDRGPS